MKISLVSLLALFTAVSGFACSAPADDGATTDADELRKTIKPSADSAVFAYDKPTWSTTDVAGSLEFYEDGSTVAVGSSSTRTPGTHAIGIAREDIDDGRILGTSEPYDMKAGTTTHLKATGLRVRFDKPVTLGGVTFASPDLDLSPLRPWATKANGITVFTVPGTEDATSSATSSRLAAVSIAEGQRGEMVLPIARVEIHVDSMHAAYPDVPSCRHATIEAGGEGGRQQIGVRDPDGTAIARQVVPQGDKANVTLGLYGVNIDMPTQAGQTIKIVLNRLEVDDIDIPDGTGGTYKQQGQYSVERKLPDGTYQYMSCAASITRGPSFPTRSGLDLPDGTYRITSTTLNGPTVPYTHVDEVSFP